MKLSQLQTSRAGGKIRVEVTATWEQAQRAPLKLFVETGSDFADGLALDYDAFVTACAIPAMHFGERRLALDGDLCPKLANGLAFVMEVMRQWYSIRQPAVALEPKDGFKARYPLAQPRSGMLLSGGVD